MARQRLRLADMQPLPAPHASPPCPLAPQMEMQLQEMVGELAELLPEASQAQLDDLAQQMETVEEQLAALKVGRRSGEECRKHGRGRSAVLVVCLALARRGCRVLRSEVPAYARG